MKIFELSDAAEKVIQQKVKATKAVIQADCVPFLTAINYNTGFSMYRGVKGLSKDAPFIKAKCPVNRTPKDMDEDHHKWIDSWFFKKYGIRYRSNAIFCSGRRETAVTYGELYSVFPIGNFDFCWSPNVRDLYLEIDESEQYFDSKKEVYGLLPDLDYHNNTSISDFCTGIKSGNEMMIHCNEYYLVRPWLLPYLQKEWSTI